MPSLCQLMNCTKTEINNKLAMSQKLNYARKLLQPIEGIILFIIITLLIHYSFRYWANNLQFKPIAELVDNTQLWLSRLAFLHTSFVMHFFGYQFTGSNNTITFQSGSWMAINTSCSGFKQILQAFFLFLLFPGKIKHKLWFIPLAIGLMHIANIIRLTGVALTMYYHPEWWKFSHDYIFRGVFYLILFLLWVWWEEKFRLKKTVNLSE